MTTAPTKKAPAKKTTPPPAQKSAPPSTPPQESHPKRQGKQQDSGPLHGEATPRPTDPALEALQQEAENLAAPADLGKADMEFIDPDPGYNVGQVDTMREYYGID
jgi:predicted lipid-binding transport protein (Tim44 family)